MESMGQVFFVRGKFLMDDMRSAGHDWEDEFALLESEISLSFPEWKPTLEFRSLDEA